jgi:multiple sugar transport system ATP-binding protein
MAAVVLSRVGKDYPGVAGVVRELSVTIASGEFLVFVGPSGCGKSTTLRMIAGLEDISRGTIEIAGRVVNDVPPKAREIAMVFQNYALYPHMTVFENMEFGLKLRGTPRPERQKKVEEVAELLGISALLPRRPAQLSGGQRQRVAVGRAMVRQPAVYLFDEPLSNLDARLRVEMRVELKRLHRALRTTTIYVTHDQEEAMTLGDRVMVMDKGELQQCAPPLEIFDHPANRFVAGFLGTPPMNFIDGKVVREGELRFRGSGLHLALPDSLQSRLGDWVDREVVLGVRPEHVKVRSQAPNSGRGASLKLDVVQPLGSMADVHLSTTTGQRLVARLEVRQIEPGTDSGVVDVEFDRVHLFEPGDHGKNLALP